MDSGASVMATPGVARPRETSVSPGDRARLIDERARALEWFQSFQREQSCIGLVLPNGVGALARCGERRDQPVLRLVIGRVGCEPALRDGDRARDVPRRHPPLEDLSARLAELTRIPGSTRIDPALPCGSIDEMNTVEKWAVIEAH